MKIDPVDREELIKFCKSSALRIRI